MKDANAIFWHKVDVVTSLLSKWHYTLWMRLRCALRGVQIGRHNYFYGMAYFQRTIDARIEIGNNCQFRSKPHSNLIGINHQCIVSTMLPQAKISIGKGCGFSGTTITAFESIKIGNNVRCGANTLISDSDWHEEDARSGGAKPVVIEDNVWLGYGVVVWKGVTIGKNSVIGVNSVVTRDIPANVVAAGNPCRVIRQLDKNIHEI